MKSDMEYIRAESNIERSLGLFVYISYMLDLPKSKKIKRLIVIDDIYVLELMSEATERECDVMDLVFIGRGYYDDEHVLRNYEKKTRRR